MVRMNGRERLMAALRREELDRYPIDGRLVTEYRNKSYASKLFGASGGPGL